MTVTQLTAAVATVAATYAVVDAISLLGRGLTRTAWRRSLKVLAERWLTTSSGTATLAFVLGLVLFGPVGIVVGAAGYLVPRLRARGRVRAREKAVEEELADVLDLLRVCVASGHSPWRAIAEVGHRHPGVLAQELLAAASQVSLGVPGGVALERLRVRAGTGVEPLVSALERADRHGAPLDRTLRAQALDARSRRAARQAERAARAAPKIQLVVALLLVPAVLLLVAAALLPAVLA